MVKVLIVGATGYVGKAIAGSLIRSGDYTVYGLARSDAKAQSLAKLEIIPVVCPDLVRDPEPLLQAIAKEHINIIVACGADQEAPKLLEAAVKAGKHKIQARQDAGETPGPKLGFVYTSGIWVHGSSLDVVSDADSVGSRLSAHPPATLVSWRPDLERQILNSRDVLNTMIVRPALVYGYDGGLFKPFFQPVIDARKAESSTAEVTLDANCYPTTVHIDDVAEGIHLAIEKLPMFTGTGVYPVFDFSAQTENLQDIFNAFGRHIGFNGKVTLVGAGENVFAQAMSTSGISDSARARSLLGWRPKRRSLFEGMHIYARAQVA